MATRNGDKEKYETGFTPVGLISFPKLAQPGTSRYDNGKYGAGLFIHINDLKADQALPDDKSFVKKLLAVARKHTGNPNLKLTDTNYRFPLKKVSTYDEEKKAKLPDVIKEDIENYWYLKSAGKFKPTVVGPDGKQKWDDARIEKDVKAGGRARLGVTFAPYKLETDKSLGTSLWLNGAQYIQDKYEFRGSIAFDEVAVEASEVTAPQAGQDMFG